MRDRTRMPAARAFLHSAYVGGVLLGVTLVVFILVSIVQRGTGGGPRVDAIFVVALVACAIVGWTIYALLMWRLTPRGVWGHIGEALLASYAAVGLVFAIVSGGDQLVGIVMLAWGAFTIIGSPVVVAVVAGLFARGLVRPEIEADAAARRYPPPIENRSRF